MDWYRMPLEEVRQKTASDLKDGLSKEQASKKLLEFGENALRGKKKTSLFVRFLMQFKDAMVLILLAAAAVSFFAALGGHDKSEFLEPVIILLIVIINAVMGLVQENKAEQALDALRTLSSPTAKVIRGGKNERIPAKDVVPGDLLVIEAGDLVPADARLVESASLRCEESALTGESVPSEKDAQTEIPENAPLGDRSNMIYSGSSVAYGRGKAIVTSTGMNTEVGKIATLLEEAEDTQTPLQQKLTQLGKYLGVVALAVCAVIFFIGFRNGLPLKEIFMTSVSLAVSAIPEGLPAVVTIVLALGVQRMVKHNAIVRKLPAVETLGSASVICSDKTGTLTQNRMTVMEVFPADGTVEKDMSALSESGRQLLRLAMLASDAVVEVTDGRELHVGDPTETAIVAAALRSGMLKEREEEILPRVEEIPFDSDRKRMSTVHKTDLGYLLITKGAFDVMLPLCNDIDESKAREVNDAMAKHALRVLAVAVKELKEMPPQIAPETLEKDLKFLGLIGMIDPPREEAKEAVHRCKEAGIRPVMITGDHVLTASAIAAQLGILNEGEKAITGAELKKLSEQQLAQRIEEYSVYARVSPEDKIRIVRAWQNKEQIVSMTGDGVNDAPALKAADIGCAMGITGTDVAKGAADIVLTDDNFATIVRAVQEGRAIYDNIRKAVQFLLGTNVGELFTVFVSMLLWHKSPLSAIHLLWLNLVTDGFPALALGVQEAEPDVMKRKPKAKREGLFAGGLGVRIVLQGILFAALTLYAFHLGELLGGDGSGQTMAFLVLSMSQLFHALNVKSPRSIFRSSLSRYMAGALVLSFLLIALIVFVPPIAGVFQIVRLPAVYYAYALGLSLVPVVVIEIEKLLKI